jgi:hypothetical protein
MPDRATKDVNSNPFEVGFCARVSDAGPLQVLRLGTGPSSESLQ